MELTGDVHALAPLLAASASAYAVAMPLLKRSILAEKIAHQAQHVTRDYSIDPHELTRVAAVTVRRVDTLSVDLPLDHAVAAIGAEPHHAYPVLDVAARPVGFASRADAQRWATEDNEGLRLGELSGRQARCPARHCPPVPAGARAEASQTRLNARGLPLIRYPVST